MATPTNDPMFPPRNDRATAAPDGMATNKPTINPRGCPLIGER